MGAGWYRDAYYPAEALIDRRSVDSLADEIVREATEGSGTTGVRPGIIGEIGTDKPWISAREERVHRAAARAARRTGLAITTHAVQSAVGLDQLDVFEAEGADLSRVVIGHADSNPSLDYHLAIVERGATVEFDFLGMSFTPLERHGEGRIVELDLRAAGPRPRRAGAAVAGCLPRLAAQALRRQRLQPTSADTFLPRLREAGVSDDEIRTITVDNPRRLLTIAWARPVPGRGAAPASRIASTVSSTLPEIAREIGQPSLAPSAASGRTRGRTGPTPRTVIAADWTVQPGVELVGRDLDRDATGASAACRPWPGCSSRPSRSTTRGPPRAAPPGWSRPPARSSGGPRRRQVGEDPGRGRGHRSATAEEVAAPGRFGSSCRRHGRTSGQGHLVIGTIVPQQPRAVRNGPDGSGGEGCGRPRPAPQSGAVRRGIALRDA